MVINGEYTSKPPVSTGDSAAYAWEYTAFSPIEKLYTFLLKEDAFGEFRRCVEENKRRFIDREFHSLEILRALQRE